MSTDACYWDWVFPGQQPKAVAERFRREGGEALFRLGDWIENEEKRSAAHAEDLADWGGRAGAMVLIRDALDEIDRPRTKKPPTR